MKKSLDVGRPTVCPCCGTTATDVVLHHDYALQGPSHERIRTKSYYFTCSVCKAEVRVRRKTNEQL